MVMIWHVIQSLLDDPLTSSSSSSSSESGFVTWMQKRPLMQTQTWPPPHIMSMKAHLCDDGEQTWLQYILFLTERILKSRKCSAFNYQSSHDAPFLVSIDGRNDSPIAATNWNILLEMIFLLLCTKWQGSWNLLCLCNEQLMIIKHSNPDLTWQFNTLTWH